MSVEWSGVCVCGCRLRCGVCEVWEVWNEAGGSFGVVMW
jgi:hypothetical protein